MADAVRSGRPRAATLPDVVATAEAMIRGYLWMTTDRIDEELILRHGLAHELIHDDSQYHKILAR